MVMFAVYLFTYILMHSATKVSCNSFPDDTSDRRTSTTWKSQRFPAAWLLSVIFSCFVLPSVSAESLSPLTRSQRHCLALSVLSGVGFPSVQRHLSLLIYSRRCLTSLKLSVSWTFLLTLFSTTINRCLLQSVFLEVFPLLSSAFSVFFCSKKSILSLMKVWWMIHAQLYILKA